MSINYSNDRSVQILLSLLKAHGIKKVIASPGTTNIALVGSMQQDPWFEMYSSVDERSAAYMACGMASETGQPVVITCTGATASRNYFPGLTEAYYRKLPILAITGSHGDEMNGHLHAQSLDRRVQPYDTVKMSVAIDRISNSNDEWATIVNVNKAILELSHHGGGPVHINLREATGAGFGTPTLPDCRVIRRYTYGEELPELNAQSVAIFLGAHRQFTSHETELIDTFCERYNAAVFCDHTSGYHGKYKALYALPGCQTGVHKGLMVDVVIHLGEVSGDFYSTHRVHGKNTWRVSIDGEIRDIHKNLTKVFEMDEATFFQLYCNKKSDIQEMTLYVDAKNQYETLFDMIPELPFGNIWCAQQLHDRIPKDSVLHFAIFNSLRSWNFFKIDESIVTSCNVGGFGIDGPVSTLIGASLMNPQKLYFGIIGDLAFFYDLNSFGNRHVGKNIRILLVNNGVGTEFRNYDHPASKWGNEANKFMAAAGHFGNKSHELVKNYAENLGFKYLSASNKEEFKTNIDVFTSSTQNDCSVIFEIFTTPENESEAIKMIREIIPDDRSFMDKVMSKSKSSLRAITKNTINGVKKIIK